MLIHLYGEFWNPDVIEWGSRGKGNKGKLLGKTRIKFKAGGKLKERVEEVDFWDARGVYALYDNFQLVYVGQAIEGKVGCLGKRLRDHLTDLFAGRWDMFSWFSTSSLRRKKVRLPGQRQVSPSEIIDTLEAFAILLATPPLNRKYNHMPKAREVEQKKSPHPQTVRHYLETILQRLPEDL